MGWGNLTKSTRGWIKDNFESIKDKPTRLITGVEVEADQDFVNPAASGAACSGRC